MTEKSDLPALTQERVKSAIEGAVIAGIRARGSIVQTETRVDDLPGMFDLSKVRITPQGIMRVVDDMAAKGIVVQIDRKDDDSARRFEAGPNFPRGGENMAKKREHKEPRIGGLGNGEPDPNAAELAKLHGTGESGSEVDTGRDDKSYPQRDVVDESADVEFEDGEDQFDDSPIGDPDREARSIIKTMGAIQGKRDKPETDRMREAEKVSGFAIDFNKHRLIQLAKSDPAAFRMEKAGHKKAALAVGVHTRQDIAEEVYELVRSATVDQLRQCLLEDGREEIVRRLREARSSSFFTWEPRQQCLDLIEGLQELGVTPKRRTAGSILSGVTVVKVKPKPVPAPGLEERFKPAPGLALVPPAAPARTENGSGVSQRLRDADSTFQRRRTAGNLPKGLTILDGPAIDRLADDSSELDRIRNTGVKTKADLYDQVNKVWQDTPATGGTITAGRLKEVLEAKSKTAKLWGSAVSLVVHLISDAGLENRDGKAHKALRECVNDAKVLDQLRETHKRYVGDRELTEEIFETLCEHEMVLARVLVTLKNSGLVCENMEDLKPGLLETFAQSLKDAVPPTEQAKVTQLAELEAVWRNASPDHGELTEENIVRLHQEVHRPRRFPSRTFTRIAAVVVVIGLVVAGAWAVSTGNLGFSSSVPLEQFEVAE